MSFSDITRGEGSGALRWDLSPVHSAWEEDLMPLRQVASDSAARQEHLLVCFISLLCAESISIFSLLCACLQYPGGAPWGQVKSVQARAGARVLNPGPCTCEADVMPVHHFITY